MQGTGSFRLIVRRGPQPNQIYELTKDVITLGRDITNDIVINDPEVSRHHIRFTRGGGGYTLEDLGSTNGTFINGQRLTGARPMSGGDMVGLGETVTLSYETATMPAAAPDPSVAAAGTVAIQSPVAQNPYAPAPNYASQGGQPQAAQPANPYAPPPPPPPQYQYPQDQPAQGGMARYIFLGCGCAIVLCVVLVVVLLVVLYQTHGGCDITAINKLYENVKVLGTCATTAP